MPIVFLSPLGNGAQFFDANGDPLAGGFLNTYAAGTTTPQATYTTKAGTVANANPIQLASDGRVSGEIWLAAAQGYKFVLVSSVSTAIPPTLDDIYGINDPATNNAIGYTGATISGALTMNLAAINEAQGANIPVAAAINLTTATGNYLSLTGSGTITSLQLMQGAYREFVVNTVSSAFQNSANLIMLGGASITPAVGDIIGFRGEAAPVVRNVLYERAGGAGVGATLSNVMTSQVNLTNSTAFVDGPSVSVGSLGTWYASGNVTLQDATSGTVLMAARLWDGSRIIDEAAANIFTTGAVVSLHLSGLISAPVGNLRISARDATTNAGNIVIAASNVSCAGVISAVRVG